MFKARYLVGLFSLILFYSYLLANIGIFNEYFVHDYQVNAMVPYSLVDHRTENHHKLYAKSRPQSERLLGGLKLGSPIALLTFLAYYYWRRRSSQYRLRKLFVVLFASFSLAIYCFGDFTMYVSGMIPGEDDLLWVKGELVSGPERFFVSILGGLFIAGMILFFPCANYVATQPHATSIKQSTQCSFSPENPKPPAEAPS